MTTDFSTWGKVPHIYMKGCLNMGTSLQNQTYMYESSPQNTVSVCNSTTVYMPQVNITSSAVEIDLTGNTVTKNRKY